MSRSLARSLTACLSVVGACGYSQGFGTEHLGVRSVAIAAVKNKTWRQGLDLLLARQLSLDLTEFTGLVPASPDQADSILEVTLEEASGRSIIEGGGGSVVEGALLLAVRVRLRDRDGNVIHDDKLTDRAEFRSPVGED
ncbi:MAG: LPS assembly lipoprotein LptE, partial [Planctomycetota bacterium]